MAFLLNAQNIFAYLVRHNLCHAPEEANSKVEPIAAKNFNLLVTFPDGRKLLVKQERHDKEGKTAREFVGEWRIQQLLQQFLEIEHFRSFLPEVLHFDEANAILVFNYLDEYRDLMDFYGKEKRFPIEIASKIGNILGIIHKSTTDREKYQAFFTQNSSSATPNQIPRLIQGLERISPEIFGSVPTDGLKFFALYQRYDSLGQAITELGQSLSPSCLTHNDLKLNNILLHNDWQQASQSIRIIDWERSYWGDPAFDLGTIVSSYVQIWLSSLVISKSLTIEESLRLAMTPLEEIQPSIAALILAYFDAFPEILEQRPDFLKRVIQFSGFCIIQQIQSMIQYQKSFGNMGIAMLQVAKTLLCRPEASMPTIFGAATPQLTQRILTTV